MNEFVLKTMIKFNSKLRRDLERLVILKSNDDNQNYLSETEGNITLEEYDEAVSRAINIYKEILIKFSELNDNDEIYVSINDIKSKLSPDTWKTHQLIEG